MDFEHQTMTNKDNIFFWLFFFNGASLFDPIMEKRRGSGPWPQVYFFERYMSHEDDAKTGLFWTILILVIFTISAILIKIVT